MATVFYSWQSDLPSNTNRGFLLDCLKRACKRIRKDASLSVEPRVDHDTLGEPGAPDIGLTILAKIEEAAVFVADLSVVSRDEGRAYPNPNVVFELGFAIKALGIGRMLPVFNKVTGKPSELPFDIRQKRMLLYSRSKSGEGTARKDLAASLESALREILREDLDPSSEPMESAVDRANRISRDLAEKKRMRDYLFSVQAVEQSYQEVEKLFVILEGMVQRVTAESGELDIKIRYNRKTCVVRTFRPTFSCRLRWYGMSMNSVLDAELEVEHFKNALGFPGEHLLAGKKPRRMSRVGYKPHHTLDQGWCWIDSSGSVVTHDQVAEDSVSELFGLVEAAVT